MINKLNIFEIRKDAIRALRRDTKLYQFIFIYYLVPISIAVLLHYFKYDIETRMFRNLIGGISLFAGLLFSIIFIVGKNYSTRKEKYNTGNEEDLQYLKTYKLFANNLVSLVSYLIIKAILIVSILIISDAYKNFLDEQVNFYLRLMWDFFVLLIIQFVLLLFVILVEIYKMQYDEINR